MLRQPALPNSLAGSACCLFVVDGLRSALPGRPFFATPVPDTAGDGMKPSLRWRFSPRRRPKKRVWSKNREPNVSRYCPGRMFPATARAAIWRRFSAGPPEKRPFRPRPPLTIFNGGNREYRNPILCAEESSHQGKECLNSAKIAGETDCYDKMELERSKTVWGARRACLRRGPARPRPRRRMNRGSAFRWGDVQEASCPNRFAVFASSLVLLTTSCLRSRRD